MKRRKIEVQDLAIKTLTYWTISQAARGFGKVMTVGKALNTASDLMSVVGPHRKLLEVTAKLQQDLVDNGGCKKKTNKLAPLNIVAFKQ